MPQYYNSNTDTYDIYDEIEVSLHKINLNLERIAKCLEGNNQ